MALITWSDELSVNVDRIDGQHRQLVIMINDLNDAMKAGKGQEILNTILEKMVGYAEEHFILEEYYFEKFGYSEAATHKSEHDQFVKKVVKFISGFDSGKPLLTLEVIDFLKDWLIDHIKGSDQKYSVCFNENGLT